VCPQVESLTLTITYFLDGRLIEAWTLQTAVECPDLQPVW